MEDNVTVTQGRAYRKAWTTNANTSSFASRVPTTTEPTNDGVINLVSDGVTVPQWMQVLPYGLGSDNDVADLRVIGWRHIGAGPPQNSSSSLLWLWVPTILFEATCTFSAAVGVAGSLVLNTERFADTIVQKSAAFEASITADVTRQGTTVIFSPTADLIAWFALELRGMEKVELTWDQTTGTPTMNALISFW